MSNDLILTEKPTEQQLLKKSHESKEIAFEDLPPLSIQQHRMLNFIIKGDNYTKAYKKAGYESIHHADKAAHVLISRNPLKAHLEYFWQQIAKTLTPEWKASKLAQIVNTTINADKPDENERDTYNPDIAMRAIQELNKMSGDYAATQVNVQSVSATVEDIRNARAEYKKDR